MDIGAGAPRAAGAARALWALYARRRFGVLFATLLLALVGHAVLEDFGLHPRAIEWLLALSLALWALVCVFVMVLLVRHALGRGPVDSERIFAVLDVYLLAAAVFGVVYWLLDRSWPESIGPDALGAIRAPDALYLSLVTISTVGFGDFVPLSGTARALATAEAVGGQMYLAVLVARLVSLYAVGEPRKQ